MLRVHTGQGQAVVVQAIAPRGIAVGLALVGRIGNERRGKIVSTLRYRRGGGAMTVHLSRPGRFDRLTAVLVNADTDAAGFSARRLDWRYLTDRIPFEIRGRLIR